MLLTTSWIADLTLVSGIGLFFLYKYLTRHFDHWEKRGVHCFKPSPLFGNFYDVFTFRKNVADTLNKFYYQTDEPYFGIFVLDTPVLVLKSPELIKTLLIKDFAYFPDRSFAAPEHNLLYSNWLLLKKYGKWKKTRSKIRPIFSSGNLKTLFPTIAEVTDQFKEYLKNNLGPHFAKTVCERFSSEIVSRCFFGVDGKCFESEESQFLHVSRKIFTFHIQDVINQGMYVFKPELVDIFKVGFIRKKEENFLVSVFKKCLETRNSYTDKIRDYIDFVIMEKSINKDYTEKDLMTSLANSIEAVVAGVDTISTMLSFTLYHLALDGKIQNNLRKNVQESITKYGSITYEGIKEMKYVEMCINEIFRLYVTLQFLDRKAVQDYRLEQTELLIEKGTIIYVPTYSIHMDEKYFPEPEKFNPERFLDTHLNGEGLTFLPFGGGPRMCVAAQFAKLVLKQVLAEIVSTFEIQKCEDTPEKFEFEPKAFTLQSSVKLPIKFKIL